MLRPRYELRALIARFAAILVWLIVWHVASSILNQPILLVSPFEVVKRIALLIREATFWQSIATSLFHIVCGFALALIAGVVLAMASSASKFVRILLEPVISAVRAAPVASFIILVLVWVHSQELSSVISFLMAFPIIYINVLQGIDATPLELIEMADVFTMSMGARIKSIYLSSCMPYVRSALKTAFGFAWKAGVAAEVIGLPKASIGEQLYNAKIFLDTTGVLAWTVVIVVLSIVLEYLSVGVLDMIASHIEAGD